MARTDPIMLTPVQRYLSALARMAELAENDQELPAAETVIHLNSMLTACAELIRENDLLSAQLRSADTYIAELEIDNAVKDIEIFNFDSTKGQNE